MTFAFIDNTQRLGRDELLAYVDNLEGKLRDFMAGPDVTHRLKSAFNIQPGEARVLHLLSDGRAKTKEQIWTTLSTKLESETCIKVVDVRICTLRRKTKALGITIETVWGVGYQLTAGADIVRQVAAGGSL